MGSGMDEEAIYKAIERERAKNKAKLAMTDGGSSSKARWYIAAALLFILVVVNVTASVVGH